MCKHSISLLFKLAQINLIQFIHSSVNAYCATQSCDQLFMAPSVWAANKLHEGVANMFNFQCPWQHVVGTSLVFTGSAVPEQPPRKKCKRKVKDTSNANALSSLQLEGSSGIAPPCTLPALTFANAVEVTDTAERFPTWVEDVFQQTSQLQCSHFLPFASLCYSPRPESVQTHRYIVILLCVTDSGNK